MCVPFDPAVPLWRIYPAKPYRHIRCYVQEYLFQKRGHVLRVDLRALLKSILGHSFYKIFGSRMYGPGTLLVYITGQKNKLPSQVHGVILFL